MAPPGRYPRPPVGSTPPGPQRTRGRFAVVKVGTNRTTKVEVSRIRQEWFSIRGGHQLPHLIRQAQRIVEKEGYSPDGRETGRGGSDGRPRARTRLAGAGIWGLLRGSEELSGPLKGLGTTLEAPGAGWSGNDAPHRLSLGDATP